MDYQSVYDQLGSVYQPQVDQVNSQIAQLQPLQDAQQSSLDQAKVNAFKGIDNTANARGMLFSGFTPAEEASYTGTKYLPAVAALKGKFSDARMSLTGQLNKISQTRSQQASSTVAANAKQASTDAYHQAQLNLGYARLGQSGRTASNKPLTATQTVGAIHDFLRSQMGKDGHVAPSVLASAYNAHLSAGGTDAAFWKNYQGYWNPKQGNFKDMFNAAKLAK